MVVVTIIGILIAIGIPTLLGAKHRAQATSAKSTMVRALKTQQVYYSDAQQTYTSNTSDLHSIEPSLQFAPSLDTAVLGQVYIKEAVGDTVVMGTKGADGNCYWTKESAGVTTYLISDCATEPDPSTIVDRSW